MPKLKLILAAAVIVAANLAGPAQAADWPMPCFDFPLEWQRTIEANGHRIAVPGPWAVEEAEDTVIHHRFEVGRTGITGEVVCSGGKVRLILIEVHPTTEDQAEQALEAWFPTLGAYAVMTMSDLTFVEAGDEIRNLAHGSLDELFKALGRGEASPSGSSTWQFDVHGGSISIQAWPRAILASLTPPPNRRGR